MWSPRLLLKYWSLQVAGWVVVFAVAWALAALFDWPMRFVWIALVLWIAKDVVLYPFVWRSYDSRHPSRTAGPHKGAECVVVRRLDPRGMVRIDGELWRAEAAGEDAVDDGATVRVASREGMTLIVERVGNRSR